MIINSGIQYRSIAAQKEFSFSFDVTASNSSGISQVGFSGDSGILPLFDLKSGNIFDINQKNIWSYNPREVVTFSGNIGSNYINYFINDNPICLFSPKNNEYYYDHWYIKVNNSSLDYNLSIKGDIPKYGFIFPDSIYFGQNISGFINNNDITKKSFKIFSGTLFSNNIDYEINSLPLFIISGNQSGQIILKPDFSENISILSPTISNLNLLLNTNFGNITYETSLNVIPAPIYYLELFTGYTGATGITGSTGIPGSGISYRKTLSGSSNTSSEGGYETFSENVSNKAEYIAIHGTVFQKGELKKTYIVLTKVVGEVSQVLGLSKTSTGGSMKKCRYGCK
jgi:hypothetical protein